MIDIISQIKAAEEAKRRALAGLHAELGYATAQALADAILAAGGAARKSAEAPSRTASSTPKKRGGGRGRRISDSVRAEIAAALKAGETASQLPEKFGVSYNIIHEIKKKIGMVTSRARSKKR